MLERFARSTLLLAFLLSAACAVDFDRSPRAAASSAIAVADLHGLPVLRLSGTPREMGFQHGKALAAGIKEGFEQFVLSYRCHGIRARYDQIRKRIENEVTFPDRIRDELAGMLEGVRASGADLSVPLLRRELELVDLEVLNSIDHWGLFGCSGFTAWGRATTDGNVLCTRNFDFDVDPETKAIARLGLVLVFAPEGRRPFASIAFPGLIGVTSGVNDDGVATFLHVGNGIFGSGDDEGRTLPLLVVSRTILEECGSQDAEPRAKELLATAHIRNPFLFRVVTAGENAPPTAIFEIDGRAVQEQALPDVAAGAAPLVVTTNHYLTRTDHFDVIPDSKVRYLNLEEDAKKCFAGGDHVIDFDEAWRSLGDVAQQSRVVTLHSLVFEPRTRELWLALCEVDSAHDHVLAAARRPPVKLHLADLFGAR